MGHAFDPATARIWTQPLTDPADGATNGCVVAWEGLRLGTNENSSASFQVEVHSNGLVRILHGPVTGVAEPGAHAVIGVQNGIHGWSYSAFDSDGDGLPDGWEVAHGLDPLSAEGDDGAEGDPDGDGRDNLREFQEQTHPRQADSEPGVPPGAGTAWVEISVDTGPQNPGEVHLVRVRGLGSESNRTFAIHNWGGGRRSLQIPLKVGSHYRVDATTYGPEGAWNDYFGQRLDARLTAGDGVCLGIFGALPPFREASDGRGGGIQGRPPLGGWPEGEPGYSAVLSVCHGGLGTPPSGEFLSGSPMLPMSAPLQACTEGCKPTATSITGLAPGLLVFDPLNTTTNIGIVSLVEPPLCRSTINWGVTADVSTGDPAPGVALGSGTSDTNSTVFVDWKVAALTNYTQAVSAKNCRIGSGTIEIGAVVKVGLDVTDADGTTGPNGDMHDAGDNLSNYLPGYVGERPVIEWDKENNRLKAQPLQIRVETLGGSWTNAKISLSSVLTSRHPGWCTNTREPNRDDLVEIRNQWFREDFSLSETEFLNELHLPLGDGETVAVADLYCRDYGGKCRVYVELTGHGWASLNRSFTIPRDDDADGIADCWEHTAKADWESVHGPVETNALDFITRFLPTEPRDPDGGGLRAAHLTEGDGLSPFDEYRGYSLPGTGSAGGVPHLRLSPAR